MASQEQSTTSQPWGEALDHAFIQRLWRPIAQPGQIAPQQAQGIINRSNAMTPELPLADQLTQRLASLSDVQVGQAPIVYVQPQPVADNLENSATPSPSLLPARPIVAPAAPMSATQTPLQPVNSDVQNSGAQNTVIQRQMAPASSAQPAHPPPGALVAPPAAQDVAMSIRTPMPLMPQQDGAASATSTTTQSSVPLQAVPTRRNLEARQQFNRRPIVKPAKVKAAAPEQSKYPVVRLGSLSPKQSPTQMVASPIRPVGAAQAPRPNGGATPNSAQQRVVPKFQPTQPTTAAIKPALTDLPMAGEGSTRHVQPLESNRPVTSQRMALPLAPDRVVQAFAQGQEVGMNNAVASKPVMQDYGQSAQTAQSSAVVHSEPKPPTPPPVDIRGVVNKVQRNFIHQMAIEAERRGVRR